ncbi:uncharacterized protein ARMOST_19248 [Armillaria ostoyae]|uniref:Uncharacterized protein n=1 Tax=Armillaria ostoyae TaxID=47428 RepID=A0A284S410_ARMOS|nr:uncharacterized protein ARMOST_19248 [Armillaria ostoyae]
MTYSQCPPNLYASPHHCADTSDIFSIYGSSIGDPDLFNNELYYLSPLSTLSSHSFDASFGLYSALPSCTERITDLEIPLPHTNETADEGRAESSPTIGHKDPTENRNDTCYRYYTSDVSCANNSPDAYNTTVSASFPSLIMGSAPMSEGPCISPECPAIVPNVTSQLDTTATPCTRNTLLPRALNSSITGNEITACDNTSSESIREELSACCIDTIRPQICPPGYQKRSFPSEMTEKLIRDYNIPAHHVYYYWRDQDRDDHTCPLNCLNPQPGPALSFIPQSSQLAPVPFCGMHFGPNCLALLASVLCNVRALPSQGDFKTQRSNTYNNVMLMEIRDRPAQHVDLSSIIAVVSLILLSAMVFAVYYYGPSLCKKIKSNITRIRARNRCQKAVVTEPTPTEDAHPDPGPGFGFDGLSRLELEELRLNEEVESTFVLVKIPDDPPELSLCHLQSLPSLTLRFDEMKEVERA